MILCYACLPSFFGVEWNWIHHYWGHYCLTVFLSGSRIYTFCKPLIDFTRPTLGATFNCSTYELFMVCGTVLSCLTVHMQYFVIQLSEVGWQNQFHIMFKTYHFMQNRVPSYPLHTNLTPNPKFDFMQWHVINSIRIICSPVSVILVVHVTT
jgi:hypothetical protein